MVLANDKQRATNKECEKANTCARNEGKMVLLHCHTRSHISFMMQLSDGDSWTTSHNESHLFFGLWMCFCMCVHMNFLLCSKRRVHSVLRVSIHKSFASTISILSNWTSKLRRFVHFYFSLTHSPCLCRHQCFTEFCTYHRLFGGLSSFSDCRIPVESWTCGCSVENYRVFSIRGEWV